MTGNCTLVLAGGPPSGTLQTFRVFMTQAASGGPFSLTYFANVTWIGASTAPAMPTTASGVLEVLFEYVSSSLIYGHFIGYSNTDPAAGTVVEVTQSTSFSATAGAFYAISGSSAVAVTLPTAVGITGQTVRVRCVSGYTGLCTIGTTSSQTIGPAAATSQILYAGESALVQSDGANWVRTGGTIIPSRAKIYLSTTQIIPDTTETKVLFDTLCYDNTGLMATVASHQIAVIRAGMYRMTMKITAIPSGPISQAYLQLYKNGSVMEYAAFYFSPSSATVVDWNVDTMLPLAAGDVITGQLSIAGGTTIYGTASSPPGNNAISQLDVWEMPSW